MLRCKVLVEVMATARISRKAIPDATGVFNPLERRTEVEEMDKRLVAGCVGCWVR